MYIQNQTSSIDMFSHVTKWGNSLGVRIPKSIAKQLEITAGTPVNVVVEDNQIIISKPKYSLTELLKKINQKNLHAEIATGEVRGREVW
jgi:antitoxin MazE